MHGPCDKPFQLAWPWPLTFFKVKFVDAQGTTILRICLFLFEYPSVLFGVSIWFDSDVKLFTNDAQIRLFLCKRFSTWRTIWDVHTVTFDARLNVPASSVRLRVHWLWRQATNTHIIFKHHVVYWCFTSHAMIFQSYMWRTDVQADWSCTYGRATNAIDISHGSLRCPSYSDTGPPFLYGDSDTPPELVAFYDTLGIRRTYSRL